MQKQQIKQGTKQWLNLKDSRIGSSEIFGLVQHYISEKELLNVGINLSDEIPYVTAYQLYHKFKNPKIYIDPEFDYKLSKFGHRIEEFALYHLNKEAKYNAVYEKGSVYADDFKIASLDIAGTTNSTQIIKDSNDLNISLIDDPCFIVEAKAMSLFKTKKDNINPNGIDWKFIFQLQHQLLFSSTKWGKIFVVSLNKDNEFERGYISGLFKSKAFDYIEDNSKIYEFIYKARSDYQYLIQKALEQFQFDLKIDKEPELPNYQKVFNKNHKLFYNLVSQKGQILKTNQEVLETSKFDRYFNLKDEEQSFKDRSHLIHQEVRELMLKTGKPCIQGNVGKIVMQANCLRGYKNKEAKS